MSSKNTDITVGELENANAKLVNGRWPSTCFYLALFKTSGSFKLFVFILTVKKWRQKKK